MAELSPSRSRAAWRRCSPSALVARIEPERDTRVHPVDTSRNRCALIRLVPPSRRVDEVSTPTMSAYRTFRTASAHSATARGRWPVRVPACHAIHAESRALWEDQGAADHRSQLPAERTAMRLDQAFDASVQVNLPDCRHRRDTYHAARRHGHIELPSDDAPCLPGRAGRVAPGGSPGRIVVGGDRGSALR
jgi:hypothetical protein